MRATLRSCVTAVALCPFIFGCLASAPSRYYLLSPVQSEDLPVRPAFSLDAGTGPLIGIGPVAVPQHLDRPNIVTRRSANEIDLAPLDSWAEPINDNITRVLAQNLARVLPTQRIATFPLNSSAAVDYQVTVNVYRLDSDLTGRVALTAFWSLYGRDGRELIEIHRFARTKQASAMDVAHLVFVQSELLGELATDIAVRLKRHLL